VNRRNTILLILLLCFVSALSISANAQEWKFGVMSDTQWPNSPDGKNPNGVAVNAINHINQEFIKQGVKFVIEVGDLTDDGTNTPSELDQRAISAQALYNAGIGFFPLRGNHEASAAAALEFVKVFPQTQTGLNGGSFNVGTNFKSPTDLNSSYAGLTYSFDFANARFVLLDTFSIPNVSCNLLENQQTWIETTLHNRSANTHAFVFGHKGLITENHKDILFTYAGKCDGSSTSSTPNVKTPQQIDFFASLFNNNVHFYMGGHDHMHNRAIVASPCSADSVASAYPSKCDATQKKAFVQNIIGASDSYKWYIPQDETSNASPLTTNDYVYNYLTTGKLRETQIAQELVSTGYYIFTVNGPRVQVDFYASKNCQAETCDNADQTYDLQPYTFAKRETFGYSLNGQEFLVPQGGTYTVVKDTFGTTTAKILDGTNGSKKIDFNSRPMTKAVDTGWTKNDGSFASDVLSLWGMTDSLGSCDAPCKPAQNVSGGVLSGVKLSPVSDQTDTFVLSMSANTNYGKIWAVYHLVSKDNNGNWVPAVNRNIGGSQTRRVLGPYVPGYGLGTYGIDPNTGTAWAVINYNGDFALAYGGY